jgi:hypothetical protein
MRKNLFNRIIIDEGQNIRRFGNTKQGRILKSFNAPHKAVFTGYLIVDTLLDIKSYLTFLEFDHWSTKHDLNLTSLHEPKRSRYAEFRRTLGNRRRGRTPRQRDRQQDDSDWDSD